MDWPMVVTSGSLEPDDLRSSTEIDGKGHEVVPDRRKIEKFGCYGLENEPERKVYLKKRSGRQRQKRAVQISVICFEAYSEGHHVYN